MGKRNDGRKKVARALQIKNTSQNNQPESSNPSLERAKSNPGTTAELINFIALEKNMLQTPKTILRRSQRVQNPTLSAQNQAVGPAIENIDVTESDKEDLECFKDDKCAAEEILDGRSMEEKIDHLVLLFKAQQKKIQALMSKGVDGCVPTQSACLVDARSEVKKLKYKSMYIDSQKKIDVLREENNQLGKKLENALGKLEVYEKGQLVFSGVMEKLKDALLVSSLIRTTDTVMGLSSARPIVNSLAAPTASPNAKIPAAKRNALAAPITSPKVKIPAAKRKKLAEGSGKVKKSTIPSK